MMNGSVIEVTEQEAQENFEFLFALVERGNTIKIVREGGNVLMVPVPEYKEKLQMQQNFPPVPGVGNLPVDPAEFVDPIGTRDYVNEQLESMQKELES